MQLLGLPYRRLAVTGGAGNFALSASTCAWARATRSAIACCSSGVADPGTPPPPAMNASIVVVRVFTEASSLSRLSERFFRTISTSNSNRQLQPRDVVDG